MLPETLTGVSRELMPRDLLMRNTNMVFRRVLDSLGDA
jgi:hypothetical protein